MKVKTNVKAGIGVIIDRPRPGGRWTIPNTW